MLHILVGVLVPLNLLLAAASAFVAAKHLTCFSFILSGVPAEIYITPPFECGGQLLYRGTTWIAPLPPAVHTVLALVVIVRLPRHGLVSATKWQLGLIAVFMLAMVSMVQLFVPS